MNEITEKLNQALSKYYEELKDTEWYNPYYEKWKRGRPSKQALEKRRKYHEHFANFSKTHKGVYTCVNGYYQYNVTLSALQESSKMPMMITEMKDGRLKVRYQPKCYPSIH